MNIKIDSKGNNQYIIYLELPIFNVLLEFAFDKICTFKNFKLKINIIGKDEYQNDLKKSYFEGLEWYKKNKIKLLFQKIKNLFEIRFTSLFQIIIEEKKKDNPNIKYDINNFIITKEYLLEIVLRFIDYIYDYNNLFKNKCDICGRKSKYNPIEKCFFPAYYKLYANKNSILSAKIKTNEKNNEKMNLFVHEECFKKIGLRAI